MDMLGHVRFQRLPVRVLLIPYLAIGLAFLPVSGLWGEPESVQFRSRGARLLFEVPDGGARFLLQPQGRYLHEKTHGTLELGELVVVASAELARTRPTRVRVHGIEVALLRGAIVVKAYPPVGAMVQVLKGQPTVLIAKGTYSVPRGKTLVLERGSPYQLVDLDPTLIRSLGPAIDAMSLPARPGEKTFPLPGTIQIEPRPEEGIYPIRSTVLDPHLGSLRVESLAVSAQALRIEESLKQFIQFILPVGSSEIAFSTRREGELGEELTVRVDRRRTAGGEQVTNRLFGSEHGFVRSLLDRETMITSPQGGGLTIRQRWDGSGRPAEEAEFETSSPFAFLQSRPGRDRERGSPDATPGYRLSHHNRKAPRLEGLTLVTFGEDAAAPGVPELIARDFSALMALEEHVDATAPLDPVARVMWRFQTEVRGDAEERTTTLLQFLPRDERDLMSLLPLHSTSPPKGTEYEIKVRRPGVGDGPLDAWHMRLHLPGLSGPPPSLQVALDPSDRRKGTGALARLYLFRHPDPLDSADDLAEEGLLDDSNRRPISHGKLTTLVESSQLFLIALATLLFVLLVQYVYHHKFFKNRIGSRAKCLLCGATMDEYDVFKGDPQVHISTLEALAGFEADPQYQAAQSLVDGVRESRKQKTFLSDEDSLAFVIEVDWCFRCAEGLVLTRLSRGNEVLDESEIPFTGAEIMDVLKQVT